MLDASASGCAPEAGSNRSEAGVVRGSLGFKRWPWSTGFNQICWPSDVDPKMLDLALFSFFFLFLW